jgi:uncharacterized protein YecT (DUF1311 family)
MRIVIVLLIAIHSGLLFGQELDCNHPVSMADMAACRQRELRVAETDMRRVYQDTLSAFQGHNDSQTQPGTSSWKDFARRISGKLRESQANWLLYRESFCSALDETFEGGTDASIAVPGCKADLTKKRTEELKTWFGSWVQTITPNQKKPVK